jgi:hypothetical protein
MKQAETTINLIEILADFMDALDPEKFYFRLWQWLQFVRARIKISLGIIRDETEPLGISAALVDLFSGQLANMFFYRHILTSSHSAFFAQPVFWGFDNQGTLANPRSF